MIVHGSFVQTRSGVTEPQVQAWVRAQNGGWRLIDFTIDSGAEMTALPRQYVTSLGLNLNSMIVRNDAGGVGSHGLPYVEYPTTLRFVAGREQRSFPVILSMFVMPEHLDVPLLGRDILDQLPVILDRPQESVLLLPGPESYRVTGSEKTRPVR